ncbi:MAG: radical SAM protein, partial [Aequorivita sp.]|nr:radical SAM protein [Aequorivita sp.]
MLKEKKKQQRSLHKRHSELAMANKQLEKLSNGIFASGELPTFSEKIKETDQFPLRPNKLEILQINVGYMCNQVCEHCHVDAGPDRKEI